MTDFILPPQPDYASILLGAAPTFMQSEEYASLEPSDMESTGLIFAAFARFFEKAMSEDGLRQECIDAVERLASLSDVRADNLIVTEVFENLEQQELIACVLGPIARALFDQWKGVIY